MNGLLQDVVLFNTWQFSVVAYLVFLTLFYQFYRLAVRDVVRDGAATVIIQLIGALSILAFAPFFPLTFPKNIWIYLTFFIACVFYAITDRVNTTVRKHIDVSSFAIISELSTVFIVIIGFAVLKEAFTFTKALGALIVLAANFALLYQKGHIKLTKYTNLAIFAQLAFSVALSIDISISDHFNLPFYIFLSLLIPACIIATAEKLSVRTLRHEWFQVNKLYFCITGISWGLLIFFMLRMYVLGPVTTLAPIAATSVLLNVLVAALFLGERSHIQKKFLLAIVVIIGVVLTVEG